MKRMQIKNESLQILNYFDGSLFIRYAIKLYKDGLYRYNSPTALINTL